MRRIRLASFLLCVFLFLLVSTPATANDLKSDAIKVLQRAVVKALPTEGNIVRIAVLDFQNDDGTIRNAITSAITEKTPYKLIERADLDKILAEQGLQLKDIMDEKTRIEHGRLKGVQGLLLGNVQGMERGFMSYSINMNMKLDDVEKGEIVFAKDFTITAVSPWRNRLFVALIVMVALAILIGILARRTSGVKKTAIQKDVKVRVNIGQEISKAMATISEAKSKLMDKGKTNEAVLLKDAERNLLLFKESIENAIRGSEDMRSGKEFKKLLEFDKDFAGNVDNVSKYATRIYDITIAGNTDSMESEIDVLKKETNILMGEFKNRGL